MSFLLELIHNQLRHLWRRCCANAGTFSVHNENQCNAEASATFHRLGYVSDTWLTSYSLARIFRSDGGRRSRKGRCQISDSALTSPSGRSAEELERRLQLSTVSVSFSLDELESSNTGTVTAFANQFLSVSVTAESSSPLTAFQLQFGASHDELIINGWQHSGQFTVSLDATLDSKSSDTFVAAVNLPPGSTTPSPTLLGQFVVQAPSMPGRYALSVATSSDPLVTKFTDTLGDIESVNFGTLLIDVAPPDTTVSIDQSGTLVIVDTGGRTDDRLTLADDLAGNLVISDPNVHFGSNIDGVVVAADGHQVTIPVQSVTSGRVLAFLGSGNDRFDASETSFSLFVHGGSGFDTILGGAGDDRLNGGRGADYVDGGEGNDSLRGGGGRDTLNGGGGDDGLFGGPGPDTLIGDDGADVLYGQGGRDSLSGGSGADTLRGGTGRDAIHGGADADSISGNSGRDTLLGGAGADELFGGSAADLLIGGSDDDTLNGQQGMDTLAGGADGDVFDNDNEIDEAFLESQFPELLGLG